MREAYDYYNSSYMELLTKANSPTLETRRIRTMALETFKILNGLAQHVLSVLLVKREGNIILGIPIFCRCHWCSMLGNKLFRCVASVLLNALPDNFITTVDFNEFKSFMLSWNGENCKCAACKAMS